jgi:hypothetical protein
MASSKTIQLNHRVRLPGKENLVESNLTRPGAELEQSKDKRLVCLAPIALVPVPNRPSPQESVTPLPQSRSGFDNEANSLFQRPEKVYMFSVA